MGQAAEHLVEHRIVMWEFALATGGDLRYWVARGTYVYLGWPAWNGQRIRKTNPH